MSSFDEAARQIRNLATARRLLKACNEYLRDHAFLPMWEEEKGRPWSDGEPQGDPLLKKVTFTAGDVKTWIEGVMSFDVSLLCRLLLYCKWKQKLEKPQVKALHEIRNVRNELAHGEETQMSDAKLLKVRNKLRTALQTLGMDPVELSALDVMGSGSDETKEIDAELVQEAEEKAKAAKARGSTLYMQRKYEAAVQQFSQGIMEGLAPPELLAKCYLKRAQAHFMMGDYETAAEDAEQATKLDVACAKAFARLGMAAMKLNDFRRANLAFERAIALNPRFEHKLPLNECRTMAEKDRRHASDNPNYILEIGNESKEKEAEQRHGPMSDQRLQDYMQEGTVPERLRLLFKAHELLHARKFREAQEMFLMIYTRFKDADAAYNIGLMYSEGRGVKRNASKANEYYMKAIQCKPNDLCVGSPIESLNGIGQSHTALGIAYRDGIGAPVSLGESVKHMKLAAQFMCPSGCNLLGLYYQNGAPGAPQDIELAMDLFRKSWSISPLGGEAALNLGDVLIRIFPETALHWYRAAQDMSTPTAAVRAASLQHLMETDPSLSDDGISSHPEAWAVWRLTNSMNARIGANTTAEVVRTTPIRTDNPTTKYEERIVRLRERIHTVDATNVSACAGLLREAGDPINLFSGELGLVLEPLLDSLPRKPRSADEAVVLAFGAMHSSRCSLASAVPLLKYLTSAYPDEPFILKRLGSAYLFDGTQSNVDIGTRFLLKTLRIEARDKSSFAYCDALYSIGIAYERQPSAKEKGVAFLTEFVEHPESGGHRKVPIALYFVCRYNLMERHDRDKAKEALRKAEAAEKELQDALRIDIEQHPVRNQTRAAMELFSRDSTSACDYLWGGDLLNDNPFAHRQVPYVLRDEKIEQEVTNGLVGMQRLLGNKHLSFPFNASLLPVPESELLLSPKAGPIVVDEIMARSYSKNVTFVDRTFRCIVVSEFCLMTSAMFVVEDDRRVCIKVALYNHTPAMLRHLAPGQVLVIRNPLARVPRDGGATLIRVNNPAKTITWSDQHPICWTCSKKFPSLQLCRGCKQARYCDRQCQEAGWKRLGHKFTCKRLRKSRQ